jgi:protein TonB
MSNHMIQSTLTWLRRGGATVGAVMATACLFLVLPFMQHISAPKSKDLIVRQFDVADVPPPPPPPEEQKPEEEQEPEPPQLTETAQPLDLSQLELALNPGFGDGLFGDFGVKLVTEAAGGDQLDQFFAIGDLDQKPRPIFQTPPTYPAELRRKNREGTVYVLFIVDRSGRVLSASVEKSTDSAFERPAVEAVRQWRFEPGMKNGQPVPFKMKVPITFSAS